MNKHNLGIVLLLFFFNFTCTHREKKRESEVSFSFSLSLWSENLDIPYFDKPFFALIVFFYFPFCLYDFFPNFSSLFFEFHARPPELSFFLVEKKGFFFSWSVIKIGKIHINAMHRSLLGGQKVQLGWFNNKFQRIHSTFTNTER